MTSPTTSQVLKDFGSIGTYRIRLLARSSSRGQMTVLDIREHIESHLFSGYTRRGITIRSLTELELLRRILGQVATSMVLPAQVEPT